MTKPPAMHDLQPAEVSDELAIFEVFQEGYWARSTYNDSETSDLQEEWGKSTAKARTLRPAQQPESEQEKELRRSLAEAQATISQRNAEVIELQKRIHRSQQATPEPVREPLGYQRIFDAIGAATKSPAKGIVEISVTDFTRQIGGNIYTHAAQPAQTDAVCNNGDCSWGGPLSECCMLGAIGPLCPVCRETVQLCGAAQPAAQAAQVPDIDYQALIQAAWGAHKYPQGTKGRVALKQGAEWFRGLLTAAQQGDEQAKGDR